MPLNFNAGAAAIAFAISIAAAGHRLASVSDFRSGNESDRPSLSPVPST